MDELRIGMIGLDTSHCTAFTELLNNNRNRHHVKGGKVVYAYAGGSQFFSKSHSRVAGFTNKLQKTYGVEIFSSIEQVAEKSDAILLESCDGRQHLEQFQILAPYGKPVFIDKPFTCSANDAKIIVELSQKHNSPIYSASSLRYYKGIKEYRHNAAVKSAHFHGPVELLSDFPGYFWYGVHLAEIGFEIFGQGCQLENIQVSHTENLDTVMCPWSNGRALVLYGYRNYKEHNWGGMLYTHEKKIETTAVDRPPGYAVLLDKILQFFKNRQSPIDSAEMIEVVALLAEINKKMGI